MMRFFYLVLAILVLASVAVVLAEEPERSNEINWCFEGQPWGDGRCNHPDPYINDYNWRMGWLMAHCEIGYFPYELCYQVENDENSSDDTNIWGSYTFFSTSTNDDGELIVDSPPSFFLGGVGYFGEPIYGDIGIIGNP